MRASFRPPAAVCAIRSLMRHRDSLVRSGSEHLLRVQKALEQMNVLLHHVVTDITGETGLAILDAIIRGVRDAAALARHRNHRCKRTEAEIAAALQGDWRPEHLFTLTQSLDAWRYHQKLVAQCEVEISRQVATLSDSSSQPPPPAANARKRANEPMRLHLFAKFGVDLTAVDGINTQTACVFLAEVGPDVSKFPTAEHFASWLGLCPDNRISGGHQLSVATRPVANRLTAALRLAAQSLLRNESPLGDWLRRLRAKLGPPGAITATAHKLARVLYAMVKHRRAYDPTRLGNPARRRQRKENSLRRQAKELGFALLPISEGTVS